MGKKALLEQCNKLAGADYHITARLKSAPSIPIAQILFNNPLTLVMASGQSLHAVDLLAIMLFIN